MMPLPLNLPLSAATLPNQMQSRCFPLCHYYVELCFLRENLSNLIETYFLVRLGSGSLIFLKSLLGSCYTENESCNPTIQHSVTQNFVSFGIWGRRSGFVKTFASYREIYSVSSEFPYAFDRGGSSMEQCRTFYARLIRFFPVTIFVVFVHLVSLYIQI